MSEWKLHIPTEDNRITHYQCGLVAGQRVRLKKDLVVTTHDGVSTGTVHRSGEEWTVLTGITTRETKGSDPFVVFDQQVIPGSVEHALCYMVDHELDLTEFHARYKNDDELREIGVSS